MSKLTWDLIKNRKNFHVILYRRGLSAIIISLGVSCVLMLGIIYLYINTPQRNYYASNGVSPPIKLNPLKAPNMSSEALLEPDPPEQEEQKVIPQ